MPHELDGQQILDIIHREFDQTRSLMGAYHATLVEHIAKDEIFQHETTKTLARHSEVVRYTKWLLSGGGLTGALAAVYSYFKG